MNDLHTVLQRIARRQEERPRVIQVVRSKPTTAERIATLAGASLRSRGIRVSHDALVRIAEVAISKIENRRSTNVLIEKIASAAEFKLMDRGLDLPHEFFVRVVRKVVERFPVQ